MPSRSGARSTSPQRDDFDRQRGIRGRVYVAPPCHPVGRHRGRELVPRTEALCGQHGVTSQLRDVGDDGDHEAMREFVLRESKIDRDDLPTQFVANRISRATRPCVRGRGGLRFAGR